MGAAGVPCDARPGAGRRGRVEPRWADSRLCRIALSRRLWERLSAVGFVLVETTRRQRATLARSSVRGEPSGLTPLLSRCRLSRERGAAPRQREHARSIACERLPGPIRRIQWGAYFPVLARYPARRLTRAAWSKHSGEVRLSCSSERNCSTVPRRRLSPALDDARVAGAQRGSIPRWAPVTPVAPRDRRTHRPTRSRAPAPLRSPACGRAPRPRVWCGPAGRAERWRQRAARGAC